MRLNSGQCIPVSAIAQDAIDYVTGHDLDPKETILWMGRAGWSCGIPLYPRFLKGLFVQEGLPDLGVYVGNFTYTDISSVATIGAYFAYEFGGWLRQMACRIRPYERRRGETDRLVEKWVRKLCDVFERRGNRLHALQQMVAEFARVERDEQPRPKVAIFGDLYVRDNEVMNQNLIGTIEDAGGEAITTPYSDYVKIIAGAGFLRMWRRRDLINLAKLRLILSAVEGLDLLYRREVEPIIGPSIAHRRSNLVDDLRKFGMVLEQDGESYENALKILHLVAHHDDLALFVQTSPAFCCPSLVTEALGDAIQHITGVPIVTITYDGTESDKNSRIIPYIRFPRSAKTA
jgi:predicted nucleotide-binding protein (sugar kinase/HSP70/actin superfamily)